MDSTNSGEMEEEMEHLEYIPEDFKDPQLLSKFMAELAAYRELQVKQTVIIIMNTRMSVN
jgi:hypothetical protein